MESVVCVDALRRVAGGFFRPVKPDMSKPWEAESRPVPVHLYPP